MPKVFPAHANNGDTAPNFAAGGDCYGAPVVLAPDNFARFPVGARATASEQKVCAHFYQMGELLVRLKVKLAEGPQ
ncbi:MAG: hypothetical protein C4295_06775 [Candidatus Fervidibacterota bacterium]